MKQIINKQKGEVLKKMENEKQNEKGKSQKVDIYSFYVGSNNKTNKAEIEKAENILIREKVKGFTIKPNFKGFWESTSEESFIIEVINTGEVLFNDLKAKAIKQYLKAELEQYEVLVLKEQKELIGVEI